MGACKGNQASYRAIQALPIWTRSGAFALRPDYLVKKKLAMDLLAPYNDFSIAFAIVTGIPPTINVREEYE